MLNHSTVQLVAKKMIEQRTQLSVNHTIVISDDGQGVAKALAEMLNHKGYRAVVTSNHFPEYSDTIIFLNGLKKLNAIDEAIEINRGVFQQLKPLAPRFQEKGGLVIAVQNTGGNFGFKSVQSNTAVEDKETDIAKGFVAWSGGLAGLIKTAAAEWPKANCKIIDIDTTQLNTKASAEIIAQHLFYHDDELEIAIDNQQRFTTRTQIKPIQVNDITRLNAEDVLVVTGGARGITAQCIIELAKKVPVHFLLLGRTQLAEELPAFAVCQTAVELKHAVLHHSQQEKLALTPKQINDWVNNLLAVREVNHTIDTLKSYGCDVMYLTHDILASQQLQQALNEARKKWGKISGFIHAAGVLADKLISEKTLEQFNHVFNTKVITLKNLLQATRNDNLKLMVMFSSVAARYGNIGQCDYAMANEVLNKVAQHEQSQRKHQCLVKSINWGPWEGGMVSPELKQAFAKRGITLLPVEQGTQLFLAELTDQQFDQVEVICGSGLEKTATNKKTSITQIEVTLARYPFLSSHIIQTVPVVPMCLAMEWMLNAAQKHFSDQPFELKNVRVLKGIQMQAEPLKLECCTEIAQHGLQLQIKQAEQLHYTAEAIATKNQAWPQAIQVSTLEPWPIENLYPTAKQANAKLFHGPLLQTIAQLKGKSAQGGIGLLKSSLALGWSKENSYLNDIALLDGVLQLIRVWGFETLGRPTLPTALGELWIVELKAIDQATCIFTAKTKGKYCIIADADLLLDDGTIYASLRNIEMHTLSG